LFILFLLRLNVWNKGFLLLLMKDEQLNIEKQQEDKYFLMRRIKRQDFLMENVTIKQA